jgi:antitoxin component YwqK of YwqJK toxin-antitoxin module
MKKIFKIIVFLICILVSNVLLFSQNYKNDTLLYSKGTTILNGDTINKFCINGNKDGFWLEYKENDNYVYMSITGEDHGEWELIDLKNETYYPSDYIIIGFGHYSNGKKIGLWKRFYFSGNVSAEINYKNDRIIGTCNLYYESGQIMIVASIVGEVVIVKRYGKDKVLLNVTKCTYKEFKNILE